MKNFVVPAILLAIGNPGPTEEPKLTGVSIVYHTTRDDKDHDTKLYSRVKLDGEIVAELMGYAAPDCHFGNNSTSQSFEFKRVAAVPKARVKQGVNSWVKMETNGDDNWWFAHTLTFSFSDGSRIEMKSQETRFDDDERTEESFDLVP